MYCKKLHATFFSKWCIFYQERAIEKFESKHPLSKFYKCLNSKGKPCKQGIQITKEYPEPYLDIDVKRLLFEYRKPIKIKLMKKNKKENIPKLKLIKSPTIKKPNIKNNIDNLSDIKTGII